MDLRRILTEGWSWFTLALFVLAITLSVAKLIERRAKRRTEYAGPPPGAEEIAYLAGGPDRAVRAALVARTAARPFGDLLRSLREQGLVDVHGNPTADGEAAVRDARDQYAPLWPGFHPDWNSYTPADRAMAVAVFGDAVPEQL